MPLVLGLCTCLSAGERVVCFGSPSLKVICGLQDRKGLPCKNLTIQHSPVVVDPTHGTNPYVYLSVHRLDLE